MDYDTTTAEHARGAEDGSRAYSVNLTFEDCTYTVSAPAGAPLDSVFSCGKTRDLPLIRNLTAECKSGHVLAILGPSGAGKTTLLNMLTLERKGGKPVGNVRLNGHPMTLEMYNDHCAYVQQNDALWASLSAHDHLKYALELFQPGLTQAERASAVERMISDVGLDGTQHVRAGNQFTRGLSGGHKRRLSIALALAKKPSVIFLDEPTTGVDSASAAKMMGFLKDIALQQGIAIVCTIHQPPASVFAGFDDNAVLASGRIAYFGKASEMGAYFERLGKHAPPDCSLAEFVLDLVNGDFTSPEGVASILNAWEASAPKPGPCVKTELKRAPNRASFARQVSALTRRATVVALREPLLYTGRMAANLVLMCIFGLVYLKTRVKEQEQIQTTAFYLMFTVGIPAMSGMIYVFASFYEAISIKREVKDGMYHPAAAAIAGWLVQTPFLVGLSIFALVPTYAIGDLAWHTLPMSLLIYTVMLWSYEGMAQLFGMDSNPLLGLNNFVSLFCMSFLFCGMFVAPNDVVWPFRICTYVLPLMWTMKAFVHSIFSTGPTYSGAEACVPNTVVNTTAGIFCGPNGYYCPNDPMGFQCYGSTGSQILESLSVRFTIFSAEVSYAKCLGIMLAIGFFFRASYLTRLLLRTRDAQLPDLPDDESAERLRTPGTRGGRRGSRGWPARRSRRRRRTGCRGRSRAARPGAWSSCRPGRSCAAGRRSRRSAAPSSTAARTSRRPPGPSTRSRPACRGASGRRAGRACSSSRARCRRCTPRRAAPPT